jgi:cell shape-determining protein MreC
MDATELQAFVKNVVTTSNGNIYEGFTQLVETLTSIAEQRKPSQELIKTIIQQCEKHAGAFSKLAANAQLLSDALIDEYEAKLAVDEICENLICELE